LGRILWIRRKTMNFYTPEELKIASHPKMQSFFRERMGEWKVGDRYHCPNDDLKLFHKTKIIEDGYFDSMKYDSEGKLGAFVNPEPCCPDACIRLPFPVDPADTGRLESGERARGLLGMIRGDVELKRESYSNGRTVYYCAIEEPEMERNVFQAGTPTLALLLALQHQIGGEVEG